LSKMDIKLALASDDFGKIAHAVMTAAPVVYGALKEHGPRIMGHLTALKNVMTQKGKSFVDRARDAYSYLANGTAPTDLARGYSDMAGIANSQLGLTLPGATYSAAVLHNPGTFKNTESGIRMDNGSIWDTYNSQASQAWTTARSDFINLKAFAHTMNPWKEPYPQSPVDGGSVQAMEVTANTWKTTHQLTTNSAGTCALFINPYKLLNNNSTLATTAGQRYNGFGVVYNDDSFDPITGIQPPTANAPMWESPYQDISSGVLESTLNAFGIQIMIDESALRNKGKFMLAWANAAINSSMDGVDQTNGPAVQLQQLQQMPTYRSGVLTQEKLIREVMMFDNQGQLTQAFDTDGNVFDDPKTKWGQVFFYIVFLDCTENANIGTVEVAVSMDWQPTQSQKKTVNTMLMPPGLGNKGLYSAIYRMARPLLRMNANQAENFWNQLISNCGGTPFLEHVLKFTLNYMGTLPSVQIMNAPYSYGGQSGASMSFDQI